MRAAAAHLLLAICLVVLAGGCADAGPRSVAKAAPPDRSPASALPTAPGPWQVVALGDSVTTGVHCSCAAFPQLYARDLSRARGVHVAVRNLGENGQDTAGLLTELRRAGSPQRRAVERADIILLTIGANDFGDHHDDVVADRCALERPQSCVAGEVVELRRHMTALLEEVRRLRAGRPTAILVTGYWNVFEDGAVARRRFSPAGRVATRGLTLQTNTVLRGTTVRAHGTYVGLYAPFHGPASRGDVTRLLAADGNHPDAAGQALIAERLLAAGLRGLADG